MRILIISQHFPPERSGNASRIFDMSNHLQKSGEDVTVLSPHPNFPHGSFNRKWSFSESKKVNEINLVNLLAWQPNAKDPGFVSRMAYYLSFPMHTILWILLHHRKFDVIITSAPPIFTGFGGLFSKVLFRKKWVMDVRDLWINASISLGFLKEGSFFEKISRMYEQGCYSRADLISGTTQELGEDILRTYRNIDENKVKVTPNGVDIELFYPVDVPKKNQMIYAGNIGHAQDLENVILSLKKINEKFDLKLIIAGDGDIKEDLMKVTSENGLDDLVEFPGMVPRESVPKMFSESLIGLAPLKKLKTLEYAVPTKAYECMACGIPFVGCGEGEIRKLAETSGGGVIAENSADDIAATILDLLEDPQKMDEMGKKGRAFVEKNYSRKQIAAGLKENLHNIGTEKMNIDYSDGIGYAGSE
ncbi:Glycosyltransferase involved in cell wall bisynthesis [Methanococcoides vulcani]|uniref:Glycosyltransferase involved in cell wall bisynthesis n=1 Tax=Methanococcoides vulcani TaxID=1353158 RepID=A0A1H9Z711_9EURY|nr:glycosyltransferase family 4 protein [Methanococcoides vulcani]SES77267.1 Glycosyltransferase involved in cell wall bisynthesis [Methanococcoides vulcani]